MIDKIIEQLQKDATEFSDNEKANPKTLLWNYMISDKYPKSVEIFNQLIDRFFLVSNLIDEYVERVCTEVYDMPYHQLELIIDDHKCIEWRGKEYFIPDSSIHTNENDELIYDYLTTCKHI